MYMKGYDGTLLTDLFYKRFGNNIMTNEKNENTLTSWYFRTTKK
jgi:hypothetical protein